MRYFITTDLNGYVLTISHTNTKLDVHELDLSQYDLEGIKKFCYKVGKDKLIWHEERYEELTKNEEKKKDFLRIDELQALLDNSDYILSQVGEVLIESATFVQFLANVKDLKTKYKTTLANRKLWRKEERELKDKWQI